MSKPLTVWITINCGKFWKRWEYQTDHLNCLLRNLYAGQEATVGTRHGTMDWFQIGKGVCQGYILSPCLFNICRAHQAKCQARWSTSWNQDCWEKCQYSQICRWHHPYGRKWGGTEESPDECEREEWKCWIETQHSKTKIMASGPITSWQINGETMETVTDFIFLGSKITADGDLQPWN